MIIIVLLEEQRDVIPVLTDEVASGLKYKEHVRKGSKDEER